MEHKSAKTTVKQNALPVIKPGFARLVILTQAICGVI